MRNLFGVLGTIIVVGTLYYAIGAMKALLGAAAPWAVGATVLALYLVAIWQAARCPDLPDSIEGASEGGHLRDTWPTVRAGLHFIMPIGILVWCLMVEQMSPSLSAFWAVTALALLMLTQQPLIAPVAQGQVVGTMAEERTPGLMWPGHLMMRGMRKDSSKIQRLSYRPCSPM